MMNDIPQTETPMTRREKELVERAGARLLIIWLLGLIIGIESLVIFHIAN
jgi:hypothetical protein